MSNLLFKLTCTQPLSGPSSLYSVHNFYLVQLTCTQPLSSASVILHDFRQSIQSETIQKYESLLRTTYVYQHLSLYTEKSGILLIPRPLATLFNLVYTTRCTGHWKKASFFLIFFTSEVVMM